MDDEWLMLTFNFIWCMVEIEYDTCRNELIHSEMVIALMVQLCGGLYIYDWNGCGKVRNV